MGMIFSPPGESQRRTSPFFLDSWDEDDKAPMTYYELHRFTYELRRGSLAPATVNTKNERSRRRRREQREKCALEEAERRLVCKFALKMTDCVPLIIGHGGCHVKEIFVATGAKVRIRGKGSGHMETGTGLEAEVPLQLAISCPPDNPEGFHAAVTMTVALLYRVDAKFTKASQSRGHRSHEPCFAAYRACPDAEKLIHECLDGVPRESRETRAW